MREDLLAHGQNIHYLSEIVREMSQKVEALEEQKEAQDREIALLRERLSRIEGHLVL